MKKICSSFLLTSFLLMAVPFSVAAQTASKIASPTTPATSQTDEKMPFSDVEQNHPYEKAVEYLKTNGIVQGYPNGEFLPEYTINRAEFVKIVVGSIAADPKGENCFSDVKNEWFAKYVCEAKTRGIIEGYGDGTFQPAQNINFVEGSKVLIKAFGLKEPETGVNDVWFKKYVEALQQEKAIPVSIDYPEKKLTRSEMSEMAWRLKANIETEPTKTFENLISDLPHVDSCMELKEKFEFQNYKNTRNRSEIMYMRGLDDVGAMEEEETEEADIATPGEKSAEPPASPMADKKTEATSGAEAESDYSQTNVQVEGVDEADVIKNDGKYIYILKGKTIRIVEANPPDVMKELTKVEIKDAANYFVPSEIYTTSDRLVVVGNSYEEGNKTKVYVFDITDRSNIIQKRELSFDGNYISSRRIGDKVYFVMNEYPQYYALEKTTDGRELLPQYFDSKTGKEQPMTTCGNIRFFPRYDQPNYLIIASVPLDNTEGTIQKQVYMGAGSTVYSSLDNLYVATQKYQYNEMKAYDIWIPPIASANTVFYRFQLDNGRIEYKGNGEVPGTLLNQFSMDEDGNTFRVATTKGEFWGDTDPTNQLYVLDRDNLNTVLGKIEDIGVGERIKSVRFMGKRAYIVTFKTIDPFFVIDLSEPTAPKILGELKIPGYSDYLHPYDENHILGFGKDADETIDADKVHDKNAVYYTAILGMKIALFDVTDVTQPKEMFKEIIGDRGTDSELLYNHKALLFSKAKNLIAFPITVAEIKDKDPSKPAMDGEVVFRGAYVYGLDLEKGFQLKAKISHFDETNTPTTPYYYEGLNSPMIKRLLYIGSNLYSVSMAKVQAHSLTDFTKQGETALGKTEDPGYEEPVLLY